MAIRGGIDGAGSFTLLEGVIVVLMSVMRA